MTFVYRRWSFLHMTFVYISVIFLHISYYLLVHLDMFPLNEICPELFCPLWNVKLQVFETLVISLYNQPIIAQKFCQKVTEVSPVRDQNLWDIIGNKWDLICLSFCLRNSGARPKNHIAGQTVEVGLLWFKPWFRVWYVYLSGFNLW